MRPDGARAADPWSRFVAYGRSKLLLWKLTQEMAPKLAERGIRVNCATPGVVDTGILSLGWPVVDRLADVFSGRSSPRPGRVQKPLCTRWTPMRRAGCTRRAE